MLELARILSVAIKHRGGAGIDIGHRDQLVPRIGGAQFDCVALVKVGRCLLDFVHFPF